MMARNFNKKSNELCKKFPILCKEELNSADDKRTVLIQEVLQLIV